MGIRETLQEAERRAAENRYGELPVFTAGEFSQQEYPEAEMIAGPMVRRGWRTILLGHTGIGKSALTVNIMRAVIHGDDFMGFENHGGGTVLLIDLEHDPSIAQIRIGQTILGEQWRARNSLELVRQAPGADRLHIGLWNDGIDLSGDHGDFHREKLTEAIDAVQPDLVVLDPVTKSFLGNPSDVEMVIRVSRFMDSLRNLYGFALLTPMHPRKPMAAGDTRVAVHDAYGSGFWTWGAEVVLGVWREEGDIGVLEVLKDRSADLKLNQKFHYTLDPRTQGIKMLEGGAATQTSQADAVNALYELLQSAPGAWFERSMAEEAMNMDRATVNRAWRYVVGRARERKAPGVRVTSIGGVDSLSYSPSERHLHSADGDGRVGL